MWGASAREHVHASFARWCLHARSSIADQGVILVLYSAYIDQAVQRTPPPRGGRRGVALLERRCPGCARPASRAHISKWSPPAPDVRDAAAPTPCGPAVSRLLRRSGGSAAPEIAAHHRRPSTTSRTFAGPGALCGNGAARPA